MTVITQDAVLATFDRLLAALTLGVAGIAAISLAVAGILVMNVMLVSVAQRTAEIGLLKALGATAGAIRLVFLTEAAMLSVLGALLGYGLGHGGAWVIRQLYPMFPAYPPDWAVLAGVGTALLPALCSACCRRGAPPRSTRWRHSRNADLSDPAARHSP